MNYKKLSVFISSCILSTSVIALGKEFKPAEYPLFIEPFAKPNIHVVLEAPSELSKEVSYAHVSEYSVYPPDEDKYGDGPNPECLLADIRENMDLDAWRKERADAGEYDVMATGRYIPWDDKKAVNGLIDGKKKPPTLPICRKRGSLRFTVYEGFKHVMTKYRNSAFLEYLWNI